MALYNYHQQAFLQNILRRGVLSVKDALDLSTKCAIDNIDDTDSLKKFFSSINKHLVKQSLCILIAKCELSGEPFVVVNQNAYDEISKSQVCFQEIELEYFHVILKEIVTNEEKALPYMNCLNLTSGLSKKFSRTTAETLLEKWITLGYLFNHDDAIRLGVRGTTEFSSYFRTHCKDYITNCCLCSELVFTGKTCASCHKTMHLYCIEKFTSEQSKCPNCKKNWDTNDAESSQNDAESSQNMTAESSDSEDEPFRSKRRR